MIHDVRHETIPEEGAPPPGDRADRSLPEDGRRRLEERVKRADTRRDPLLHPHDRLRLHPRIVRVERWSHLRHVQGEEAREF
eukprot:741528-Rhodomonas_salina.1